MFLLMRLIIVAGLFIGCYFAVTASVYELLRIQADQNKYNSTIGNIEVVDPFADFDLFGEFNFDDADLRSNQGGYAYVREYRVAVDFDGTVNSYNLLVNNQPTQFTTSHARTLQSMYEISFYGWYGNLLATIRLEIRFWFTVSVTRVELRIDDVSANDFGLFNQFRMFEGLRFRIIQEQYNSLPDTEVGDNIFVFFEVNDHVQYIVRTAHNTTVQSPIVLQPGDSVMYLINGQIINLNTHRFTQNTRVTVLINQVTFSITFDPGDASNINNAPVILHYISGMMPTFDLSQWQTPGLTFIGWNHNIVPAIANTTYVAQWEWANNLLWQGHVTINLATNYNVNTIAGTTMLFVPGQAVDFMFGISRASPPGTFAIVNISLPFQTSGTVNVDRNYSWFGAGYEIQTVTLRYAFTFSATNITIRVTRLSGVAFTSPINLFEVRSFAF